MNQITSVEELEKKTAWNKKHLRIVFILSVINFLALAGHFFMHATGTLPH